MRVLVLATLALLAVRGTAGACGAIASAGSGNWSNPATWTGGVAPTACDRVTVSAGNTVVVDVQDAAASTTTIAGTLSFSRVASSTLTVTGGSVTVVSGGLLDMGSLLDPIGDPSVVAQLVFAERPLPNSEAVHGLVIAAGGAFTARGAQRSPYCDVLSITGSGTTLSAPASCTSGWQVGDQVAVDPGRLYTPIPSIIAAISGADPVTITLETALGVSDNASTADFPLLALNLTRNVKVRSDDPPRDSVPSGGAVIAQGALDAAFIELVHVPMTITGDGASLSSSTARQGGIYIEGASARLTDNISFQDDYLVPQNRSFSVAGPDAVLEGNIALGTLSAFDYPVALSRNNVYLGASLDGCAGSTVTANRFHLGNFALNVNSSPGSLITGNRLYDNWLGTLEIFDSGGSTVTLNEVYASGSSFDDVAVYIEASDGLIFSSNTVRDSQCAVSFFNSDDVRAHRNVIADNFWRGFHFSVSDRASITENEIYGNGQGIVVEYNTGCVIADNDVHDNVETSGPGGPAVVARACQVYRNTVAFNASGGIDAYDSVVSSNVVASNGFFGISTSRLSAYSSVSGNEVFSNGDVGITGGHTIEGNTVHDNLSHGVVGDGLISSNTIYSNSGDGLVLSSSDTAVGNAIYENGGAGIRLSGGGSALIVGNEIHDNDDGIELIDASRNQMIGNHVYSNATAGLSITGASVNAFIEGTLGHDGAGASLADGFAEVFMDGAIGKTLTMKKTRLNPAGGFPTNLIARVGTQIVSYAQDYDTGTLRAWGDFRISGSTLTLEYAGQLYSAFATPAVVTRQNADADILHELSITGVVDAGAVAERLWLERRGGLWHLDGSVSGADMIAPFAGDVANVPVPAGQPRFYLTFVGGWTYGNPLSEEGDRLDFAIVAGSGDANTRKKLLFGTPHPNFNRGRSKLTIAADAGLVLDGIDGSSRTLVDRIGAGDAFYTIVDSGAFTADRATLQNLDESGLQLSGGAGVSITSTTFDYAGISAATVSFITARDLASRTTFYNVTFSASRSTAGASAFYAVRVANGSGGLDWTFQEWGGPLGGEDLDYDPSDRVRWYPDARPAPPGPVLASSTHRRGRWSNDRAILLEASGSDKLFFHYDQDASRQATQADTPWSGAPRLPVDDVNLLAEGTWYFHVTGYTADDLVAGTTSFALLLDFTLPPKIAAVQPDTVGGLVRFRWANPDSLGLAPIEGYSFSVSQDILDAPPTDGTDMVATASFTKDFSALPFGTYYVRVRAKDAAGNWGDPSDPLTFSHAAEAVPTVSTPRHNVFNPGAGESMTLALSTAKPGRVKATLYTLQGALVKVLYDREMGAGSANVTWAGANDEGRAVAAGIYLLVIQAPDYKKVHKVAVLK